MNVPNIPTIFTLFGDGLIITKRYKQKDSNIHTCLKSVQQTHWPMFVVYRKYTSGQKKDN